MTRRRLMWLAMWIVVAVWAMVALMCWAGRGPAGDVVPSAVTAP